MQTFTKLRVLDLFSGIGMFSYGLEKTGLYKTELFCEWDDKCKQVLAKNFPNIPIVGDISFLDGCSLKDSVDVITGGFPCQDISQANQNAEGISGSRSGHWKEYARLIREIEPKGVIIENVSALLRRGLEVVLTDLHSLGYDAEWHCLTAKHFGAYHERDRLFILAYRRSHRGERFKPIQHLEKVGQGWESCQKTLQQVYGNPFRRSDCFPQPLLRRVDVQDTGGVDRLKQVGNTVYWPIVETLGNHLYENLMGET